MGFKKIKRLFILILVSFFITSSVNSAASAAAYMDGKGTYAKETSISISKVDGDSSKIIKDIKEKAKKLSFEKKNGSKLKFDLESMKANRQKQLTAGVEGEYVLETEPNDDFSTANYYNMGIGENADIPVGGFLDFEDIDVFAFDVKAPSVMNFLGVYENVADIVVAFFDYQGNAMFYTDDSDDFDGVFGGYAHINPGRYYFAVVDFGDEYDYDNLNDVYLVGGYLVPDAVQTPPSSVTLDKTSATIMKGETLQLKATVLPAEAANKSVSWSSSNPSVAAVSQAGLVTAVSEGSAVIKVTTVEGGKSAECAVKVIPKPQVTPIRYGGISRFETAVKVSTAGWTTSENVVLVNAYGFADALTGVPFAYLKDAPILLSETDSIPEATNNEIIRLKAKNVYILGGTGVVSKKIEDQLKARGLNVYRTSGVDRFGTAIGIGREVMKNNPGKTAVLTTAYNYPDALAISSYSAINKFPIIYTDPVVFNQMARDFLTQYGITKVIIPGGTGAVSSAIENELKGRGITVQRIAGTDRYSTALNIVKTFKDSFKNDVMLATGENFPDALAGGVLAAKKQIPILLVEQNAITPDIAAYIKSKGAINIYILGGTGVISDNIINLLRN